MYNTKDLMMKDIKFLTIKQYAELFQLSTRTIHRMIAEKRINAIDINNGAKRKSIWRIPVSLEELTSN